MPTLQTLLDKSTEYCRDGGVRLQLSVSHLTWLLANADIKVLRVSDDDDTVGGKSNIHTTECV